jgi:phenylalanyl-tRNA synthetase beta chain
MESAVSSTSKSIIWESACFDAKSVRLTAQRHGIRTDASTRYEKSLDPLLAGTTWKRVIEYMNFLGKDYHITGSSSFLNQESIRHIEIQVGHSQIEKKIGISLESKDIERILSSLGFSYTKNDESYTITVPSWRATKDVSIPEDIIEEIGRVSGYDQVPYIPLSSAFSIGKKNHEINLRNCSNIHFSERGWNEVYNYGFTSEILDRKLGYTDMSQSIQIQNAFNVEYTHMTRSLAVRLFQNVEENQKYSEKF